MVQRSLFEKKWGNLTPCLWRPWHVNPQVNSSLAGQTLLFRSARCIEWRTVLSSFTKGQMKILIVALQWKKSPSLPKGTKDIWLCNHPFKARESFQIEHSCAANGFSGSPLCKTTKFTSIGSEHSVGASLIGIPCGCDSCDFVFDCIPFAYKNCMCNSHQTFLPMCWWYNTSKRRSGPRY